MNTESKVREGLAAQRAVIRLARTYAVLRLDESLKNAESEAYDAAQRLFFHNCIPFWREQLRLVEIAASETEQ